jgi:hypothetical protein
MTVYHFAVQVNIYPSKKEAGPLWVEDSRHETFDLATVARDKLVALGVPNLDIRIVRIY